MAEMFQPELELEQQGPTAYAITASTLVPTSCYAAGRPVREDTSDEIGIPERRAWELPIRTTDGPCLQALTTIHHRFTVVSQPGENFISVTTTLDGTEVGGASLTLPSPEQDQIQQQEDDETAILGTGNWAAVFDQQPPEPDRFYVDGTVTVASPKYIVELEETDEPRDGDQLNLQLRVTEQEGITAEVVTTRSVRYSPDTLTNPAQIETVQIRVPGEEMEDVILNVRRVE